MEADMASICEAAELFEVTLPDYRQLKACRREVRLFAIVLKSLSLFKRVPCQLLLLKGLHQIHLLVAVAWRFVFIVSIISVWVV